MKNRWVKKSLALLLALVMCVSMLPAAALAEEDAEALSAEPAEAVAETAPEESAELPAVPEEDAEEPEEAPDEPGEAPEESGDTSEEPGDTSEEPGDTSEEPGETPDEPGETLDEPGETPDETGEPADAEGLLPDGMSAMGASDALGKPDVVIHSYSKVKVNPLYADVISEADIPAPRHAERYRKALYDYITAKQTGEEEPSIAFYTSVEAASADVRAQMVARTAEISVYISSPTEQNWGDLCDAILAGSLTHTGSPREGDYLQFQWGGWSASGTYGIDADGYYYGFDYSITYFTTAAQEAEMDGRVGAILSQLSLGGKSEYQKLRTIYNYLTANVVYDYANLYDDDYMLKYTGYAALVNGTAVCQGISVAFYRLALQSGLDARVVSSSAMRHAWNIARCQGAYYALDATWDLGVSPSNYWYFLKGSTNWLNDHTLGDQFEDGTFGGGYAIPAADCVEISAYTVSYDPNGGENAPAPQTKTHGAALTLSTEVPTRSGYAFAGWALSADATAAVYQPGDSYTADADVTLYAVWVEIPTVIDSGTCGANGDNLTWTLDNQGTLTISGEGDMADYWPNAPWYSYRSSIKTLALGDGITSIGRSAFAECSALASVTLPNSVTSLGDCAFAWSSLEEIRFSENLVSIGSMALNCTALETLTIPASVTDIDSGAFWSSPKLEQIDVAADNPVYKSVDGVMFSKDGTQLEQYPDGRQGAYAVPAGVTAIGDYAFYGSGNLTTVTFPATLTSIGYRAFEGSDLTAICLPASLSTLGGRAFAGAAVPITVEPGNPNFTAVDGILYSKDMTELVAATGALGGSFTIPATVTRICDGACVFSPISELMIPASVSVIEGEAFFGCYNLSSIHFLHSAEDSLTFNSSDSRCYAFSGVGKDLPTQILVPDKNQLNPAISGYDWAGSGRDVTFISVEVYPVTYHLNGGVNDPANPESYTSLDTVTLAEPSREGYAFAGWYASEDFSGEPVTTLSGGVPAAVYAKWEPIVYSIRFDPNGGTGSMAALSGCRTDVEYPLPACGFTRTAFSFTGWNTSADGSGTPYQPGETVMNLTSEPNSIVTLYAQWAPIRYFIAFDPNGGDAGEMEAMETLYGQNTTLPLNAFARTGYRFTGWNTKADGKGMAFADGATVRSLTTVENAVVTLYAQWSPNSYRVLFDPNGGTGSMAAQAMTYDKAAALTANSFKRSQYVFLGWAEDPAAAAPLYLDKQKVANLCAEPDGSVTLYAVWAKYSYQIAFYPNGGEGDMADDGGLCDYDGTYVLPLCRFTRPGFDFLGWATSAKGKVVYQDGQRVSGLSATNGAVIKLYAVWGAHSYRIEFDPNGGTGTTKAMSCTCGKTYTLTANAFKRTGYAFTGWNTAPDGSGTAYKNKAKQANFGTENGETVTLYAQWTPTAYKITYKNVAASDFNPNPATYTIESEALILAPAARPGCDFLGWYADAKFKTAVTGIDAGTTGAKTFYARWSGTAYTYGVAFDPNGGTGTMKAMTKLSCGKSYTLTANAFKRAGYAFAGWNTAPDGSGEAYANKAKVANLCTVDGGTATLYAQWTPTVYKITYKSVTAYDENPNPTSVTVESGAVILAPAARPGCSFVGWYADSKLKTPVAEIAAGQTKSLTLYAKWSGKAATYTIAFNGNGATSGKMSSLTKRACGKGYTLTANAFKRTGYTFAGWNTAPDGSGEAYANKAKVANLCTADGGTATLYAQWEPIAYTITYKNVSQARMPEKTSYTIEEGFALPTPVKEGQVFLGWYSSSTFKAGTQVEAIEPGTTGNKTFYAKWMLLQNGQSTQ